MGVPLGHKNHRSTRSASIKSFKERFPADEYKIVNKKAALSLDGTELYGLNENFEGCYKLPKTVKTIKSGAFKNCPGLTSVQLNGECTIEAKVSSKNAFQLTYKLEKTCNSITGDALLLKPNLLISNDRSAKKEWNDTLKSLCEKKKISQKVAKYLSYVGIYTNYSNKEVVSTLIDEWGNVYSADGKKLIACDPEEGGAYSILDGVEEIGNSAVRDKDIKRLNVPSSVKKLGFTTFGGCSHMGEAYFYGFVEEGESADFDWCHGLKHIYVPNGTKEHYQQMFSLNKVLIEEKDITAYKEEVQILEDKIKKTVSRRVWAGRECEDYHKGKCIYKCRMFEFAYTRLYYLDCSLGESIIDLYVYPVNDKSICGYERTSRGACEQALKGACEQFLKREYDKNHPEETKVETKSEPISEPKLTEEEAYYYFGKYLAIKDIVYGFFGKAIESGIYQAPHHRQDEIQNPYVCLLYCPNFRYHDYIWNLLKKGDFLYLYYCFDSEKMPLLMKGYEEAKQFMFEGQLLIDVQGFIEVTNIPIANLVEDSGLKVEDIKSILENKSQDKDKLYCLAKALNLSTDDETLLSEIKESIKEESPMFYDGTYIPQLLQAGRKFYGKK